MAIEWTNDLSVGVSSIDAQHQQLFKMADELFEAGKNGKSKEKSVTCLVFSTVIPNSTLKMKKPT